MTSLVILLRRVLTTRSTQAAVRASFSQDEKRLTSRSASFFSISMAMATNQLFTSSHGWFPPDWISAGPCLRAVLEKRWARDPSAAVSHVCAGQTTRRVVRRVVLGGHPAPPVGIGRLDDLADVMGDERLVAPRLGLHPQQSSLGVTPEGGR